MLRKKELLLPFCLAAIAVCSAAKLPAAGPSWTDYSSKSAYARALGPVPFGGIDTVSVPYKPKSSLFPKFVDPKTMISKKTDMLSNLFGGVGPAFYPPAMNPYFSYGPSAFYTPGVGSEVFDDKKVEATEDKSGVSSDTTKRGVFGPVGPAGVAMSPKFGPGPKFGPMGMFGPGPKFGPMSPFAFGDYSKFGAQDTTTSRKRRSVVAAGEESPEVKKIGPPPAYPGLSSIAEESELEEGAETEKLVDPATPKQYLPGMFGPFGPLGPGPLVDPSMFISKKTAFLDTLFKTLATSTPAPLTPTDVPTPKSTIVPADFWVPPMFAGLNTPAPAVSADVPTPKPTIVPASYWAPSSIIPGPTEYNSKVAGFLEKLFDNLKLNKTTVAETDSAKAARSLSDDVPEVNGKVVRSAQDLSAIAAAKDVIVDSIMTELVSLKGDMMKTFDDMITYEKSMSPVSAKKPFKPFAGGMWGKPATDPLAPFQQKLAMYSQVFDMLTSLQKNVTEAVQEAVKSNAAASEDAPTTVKVPLATEDVYKSPLNMTLLDVIKERMAAMDTISPAFYGPSGYGDMKTARALPKSSMPFWASFASTGDSTAKREAVPESNEALNEETGPHKVARAVKMQMHQGYQSLPAGAIETVQAGGGSVPGHSGGGIKLLDSDDDSGYNNWADYMQLLRNEYEGQGRRHHHHNH